MSKNKIKLPGRPAFALLAALLCMFCGCDKPAKIEAEPDEKWVTAKAMLSTPEQKKSGLKEIEFAYLVPDDWEKLGPDSLSSYQSPLEGDAYEGRFVVMSFMETESRDEFVKRHREPWYAREKGKVVNEEEIAHPLGYALKTTWELNPEKGNVHTETYLIYNECDKVSWWITGGDFQSEEAGSEIMARAFWSLTLEQQK